MADTAPPLTEADPLSEWIARIVFAFPSGDSRRDDIRVLAARALTLESDLAQLRAFIGHVADGGSIVSTAAMTPTQIAVARAAERMFVTQDGLGFVYVPGPLTASEQDELAQLRRENAEREALERRLVAWLRDDSVDDSRSMERVSLPDGVETVALAWETPDDDPGVSVSSFVQADGPTYEAALAAALEKLGKP